MRWWAAWAAILLTNACDGTGIPAGRPDGNLDGNLDGSPDRERTGDAGADATGGTDALGGGPTACGALGAGDFCLTDPPYAGVWAAARDDVWIIESDFQEVTARHFNGGAWTTFPAGRSPLAAVWGSGRNDAWAVGAAATIVHFDGAAWSPSSAPAAAGVDLTAVWGSGPADVWAVGAGAGAAATLHFDGTAWVSVACCGAGATGGVGLDLVAVSGSGPNDVWAVGAMVDGTAGTTYPAAIHWDGTSWTAAAVPGSGFALTSVWSDGAGDVWFGAPQQIVHGAGGAFSATAIVGTVTGLWGSGAGDIWATTKAGGTVHWNGAAWSDVASGTTNTLVAISGSADDDAWAVGPAGTVLRWDGTSWTPLTDGTNGPLAAVWGDGADDVWTSGPLRWNGAGWAHDAGGSALAATGLCGFSADDVWAVGATLSAGDGNGFIAHWDGSLWTVDGIENIYTPITNAAPNLGPSSMNAIWCHTPTDVWAVGLISVITGPVADTIAHWDGTVWSPVAAPTTAFLSGVWGSASDDVWAAGGGGTLLHWDGSVWTAAPSGTTDESGGNLGERRGRRLDHRRPATAVSSLGRLRLDSGQQRRQRRRADRPWGEWRRRRVGRRWGCLVGRGAPLRRRPVVDGLERAGGRREADRRLGERRRPVRRRRERDDLRATLDRGAAADAGPRGGVGEHLVWMTTDDLLVRDDERRNAGDALVACFVLHFVDTLQDRGVVRGVERKVARKSRGDRDRAEVSVVLQVLLLSPVRFERGGAERLEAAAVARQLGDRQGAARVLQNVGWRKAGDTEALGEPARPLVQRRERHPGKEPRERNPAGRCARVQLEPAPVQRQVELRQEARHRALLGDEAERADEVGVEAKRLRHRRGSQVAKTEKPALELGEGRASHQKQRRATRAAGGRATSADVRRRRRHDHRRRRHVHRHHHRRRSHRRRRRRVHRRHRRSRHHRRRRHRHRADPRPL